MIHIKRFHGLFRRRYIEWTLSYFLLIAIILTISLITNFFTSKVTSSEINSANNRFVMQLKNIYDGYFRDVEKQAYRLVNSVTAKRLATETYASAISRDEWKKILVSDINMNLSENRILLNAYMIFQDEDLCIDNWSVFNREILYQAYFQDYYDSVDKCYADFNIPDFKEYKLIKGRNGVNKLFYISHALMERPVFIVMEFDFKDFISYTETENYGKFLLTDNENNVIFSNSGDKSPALPAYKADRQTVRNLNQGENIIGYIKSDVFPGTYVHIVEKSLYYKATLLTNKIIYISFFFCLAFSVFLAFYLAKRNSGTMDKLINKIELDEANVSKREQTLKDIFFYNFILNKISYNEKDMTHFTADFKEKYYAAALFNVTDFGVHENDSDRGKMALFNISNVFSELMSELAVCYYCEVDGLYFCLLNMKKEDLAKENITEKLRFTNEFLNRNVGMSFVYIVSGVYVSLEETPRVYLKMQDELSSKYIWGGEAETESHDGRIDEIKKYVDGNFMNGNLSVAEIADYFGLSFNYISKYFKAYTGVGLARYIVCRRVDEAKILLRQTNENLNVIAEKTGFYSTSAFIRTFKKIENMTPGQFRG